jgi:hypothetical protein
MPRPKVWYFRCTSCPERTLLPNQSLHEMFSFQKYCTTDIGGLVLLCQGCGRLSEYLESDVHHEMLLNGSQIRDPNIFWKITIECASKSCESRTVVYMRAESDLQTHVAMSRVLLSTPMVKLPCVHALTMLCPIHLERIPEEIES